VAFRRFLKQVRRAVHGCYDLPEEIRKIFNQKAAYLNEYTLRTRLGEVLDQLGPATPLLVPDREGFIKLAADTRNYLTHYTESLRGKSADGEQLYAMIQQLKAVIELTFLREMGVSEARVEAIVRQNQRFIDLRHTLGFK
jgi:hypothetical protein